MSEVIFTSSNVCLGGDFDNHCSIEEILRLKREVCSGQCLIDRCFSLSHSVCCSCLPPSRSTSSPLSQIKFFWLQWLTKLAKNGKAKSRLQSFPSETFGWYNWCCIHIFLKSMSWMTSGSASTTGKEEQGEFYNEKNFKLLQNIWKPFCSQDAHFFFPFSHTQWKSNMNSKARPDVTVTWEQLEWLKWLSLALGDITTDVMEFCTWSTCFRLTKSPLGVLLHVYCRTKIRGISC